MEGYLPIISGGLILGVCAGFVMHRSDFCLAGMFRDLFMFRQVAMLRFLFLLVGVSIFLFEAARLTGLIKFYPFPLFRLPALTNIIGGFIFGVGMVLAGGCVVGSLYKMGAGSFLSFLAFVGLIVGSVTYAEIHPFWMTFRKATTFSQATTVPQLLGIDPFPLLLAVFALFCMVCLRWYRAGKLFRNSPTAGYLQPYKAAIILAFVGLCSVMMTGMPLGITTSYAKIGGFFESLLFREHFQGLQFFTDKPQVYTSPISTAKLPWGAGPTLDAVALVQFPIITGIIAGGLLSALLLREFRIYYRVPPRQYLSAFFGGIIMGMASRMAPACNVWHLMGGVPILALQSLFFVVGLFPGAWLGSRLLVKLVIK